MTQYDQAVKAIKELGGHATTQQILDKIGDRKKLRKLGWTAKNPYATVASLISRSDEFQKSGDNKEWIYKPVERNNSVPQKSKRSSNGFRLYLITIGNAFKNHFSTYVPFKVGISGRLDDRLDDYERSLPFQDLVHLLDDFEFPNSRVSEECKKKGKLPKEFKEIEDEVRTRFVDYDGERKIRKCSAGKQVEWLQVMIDTGSQQEIADVERFIRKRFNKVIKEISNDPLYQKSFTRKPSASSAKKSEGAPSKRAVRRTFASLKIPIGSELVYTKDGGVKCATVDGESNVKYNGKTYSISGLAKELSKRPSANGFMYFTYKGRRLDKI